MKNQQPQEGGLPDVDEEDRDGDLTEPFDPKDIQIGVVRITIDMLLKRLKNGELNLTPDFQRQANLWSTKNKSRLIESILLRIPLPSFYFSEDEDGNYTVVDGLQRLCAIFQFMDPASLSNAIGKRIHPLVLSDLQYLEVLTGEDFLTLDRKFSRRLEELEITVNVIQAGTPDEVKFNVFSRLNQGGLPLKPQEIRNAIFHQGEWRDRIRTMSESSEFLRATEGKIPTQRQEDMELVLRFIALKALLKPDTRRSAERLDSFLNLTLKDEILRWTSERWEKEERNFYECLSRTIKVFGGHRYRKYITAGVRSPINRGLFEAEMIVVGELTDQQVAKLSERPQAVLLRIASELEKDGDLYSPTLYATGSGDASNKRIATVRRIVNEALND